MKKNLTKLFILNGVIALLFSGCLKDKKEDPKPTVTVNLGITDTRITTTKSGNGIIDPGKLAKFELIISGIDFVNENGEYFYFMSEQNFVNLRNYQGIVKDLASSEIPVGNYVGLYIYLTGITIDYDGNIYSSNIEDGVSLTLADYPGVTITSGISNPFTETLRLGIPFEFSITDSLDTWNLNIAIDAVSACSEKEYLCAPCGSTNIYFASLREETPVTVFSYFENGIQQIRHTPPLGVELVSGTTAGYYGIHTFVDFNHIGGVINSHTSQHVFRGDGSLFVDAEGMSTNHSTLLPSTINAASQTDVRADEVFDFSAIEANLAGEGYNLEAGETYYFSLRKTWTITSGNITYEITRMCEPIPVLWPAL